LPPADSFRGAAAAAAAHDDDDDEQLAGGDVDTRTEFDEGTRSSSSSSSFRVPASNKSLERKEERRQGR